MDSRLKFILLWIVNLTLLLVAGTALGLNRLGNLRIKDVALIYVVLGLVLAILEQFLWDRMHGRS